MNIATKGMGGKSIVTQGFGFLGGALASPEYYYFLVGMIKPASVSVRGKIWS